MDRCVLGKLCSLKLLMSLAPSCVEYLLHRCRNVRQMTRTPFLQHEADDVYRKIVHAQWKRRPQEIDSIISPVKEKEKGCLYKPGLFLSVSQEETNEALK